MTKLRVPRQLGRLWPRKVRARLALTYALLFLVSGSVLIGVTYGLLAASLPADHVPRPTLSHAQFVTLCKKPQPYPVKARGVRVKPGAPTPTPAPTVARRKVVVVNPKIVRLCQAAYEAGLSAGSLTQRERSLAGLRLYSLIGLGLMTIVSGGAGWLISGRVLRPVRMITETARRASEQHLGERIALPGAMDELKELADTFDDMLERLDQAFAAQRRFVADASHELRTPLTLMRTAIDVTLAKPSRTPEQLEAMAVRVRGAIDRSERTIDALLTLAVSNQAGLSRGEPVDLATAAEDAIDAAAADIDRLSLSVHAELDPAQTTGHKYLLERMIGNLVENAVRHNRPGGTITVASGIRDGHAYLLIWNTGPRIPAESVPLLFEPFRRFARGRSGSSDGVGLGLAIARSVAVAHHATLHARPRPAGGLEVSVTMPGGTTAGALPPAATDLDGSRDLRGMPE